jgi:putative ABC transport system ATP-binding protein
MTSPMPLIEAHDLTKSFASPDSGAPLPVLRGISLAVRSAEFVAIVGPSGSGKSTLLYCLSGLEPYTGGSVQIQGNELAQLPPRSLAALRRDLIGFIFQAFNLIPSLTARQNVALPASLAHRQVSETDIDRALAAVGLSDRAHHRPGSLSGGQQQRVAIARVLAASPRLVFADEPTGALDTTTTTEVLRLLRDLAAGERSVVMVTHDLEAAAQADRVLVLRDGLIHEELIRPSVQDVLTSLTAASQEV